MSITDMCCCNEYNPTDQRATHCVQQHMDALQNYLGRGDYSESSDVQGGSTSLVVVHYVRQCCMLLLPLRQCAR
jgi:hypothetical protein